MKPSFQFALAVLFVMAFSGQAFSQSIGIGTPSPHASAVLDLTHTGKGLLIPRMNTAGISAISNPAKGLLVFDSAANTLKVNAGSALSPDWQSVGGSSGWWLTGNSGTNPATHFIGTTDNAYLAFRVSNVAAGKLENGNTSNTTLGWQSGDAITTGTYNTAFGAEALSSNAAANFNTAFGAQALLTHTQGHQNTAIGSWAMYSSSSAGSNTAVGHAAMYSNTTGYHNVAVGAYALHGTNNTGGYNVALGSEALLYIGSGGSNAATGYRALFRTSGGSFNVATGWNALQANLNGSHNSAMGSSSLYSNTSGTTNCAFGNGAAYGNTTGSGNVAVGNSALAANVSGNYNTAVGHLAGNNNGTNPINFSALGYGAGKVGSNSNTIEIGNTSVTWIGGNVGWSTYFSDGRAKSDLKENIPGIAFIKKLRPVSYRLNLQKQKMIMGDDDPTEWAGKYDIEEEVQSGFVAQEVEAAAKELNYPFNGVNPPKGNRKLYSMQYAAFVVPLVKAVQEQQQIIENQQKQIDELRRQVLVLANKR